ncbi:MAG TPA: LamG-like jellyroll fold domain-containing protein [Candidatus Limnocylindrales bacterium]|nr:LamG-like jellyroll fold domain-containing protein [Candidatus Limnocylindrales bacterium]
MKYPIYSRALSLSEVQSVFDAGHAGKCATPVPPTIYSQPSDQTLFVGQTANLTVGASGTAPLVYQWSFNGTPLQGATNASLVLLNIQMAQAGTYVVLVTNELGSAVSSNAVLTVNPAPPCTPAPHGLVGWWRAEGNALDEIGGNTGSIVNGTGFSQGEVGGAFDFDGIDQLIRIPDAPALNPPAALTLEAWVFIRVFSHESVAIIGKDDPYSPLRQYLIGMGNKTGHWAFRAHVGTPGNYSNFDGHTALTNYTWYHVAMTYDGSALKLFVNGNLDGSLPVTGPITVSDMPLLIGGHAEGPWNFNGVVDEVSLYNRALSSSEIQSIYDSDSAGKCVTPIAPVIYLQPRDQAVAVGQNAVFTVGASGTQPLSYQWSLNGAPLPNSSNASLVITNVQLSDAGVYSVVVSNSLGFTMSSNALLTVKLPPALLNIGNTAGLGGTVVTVPVTIVANGNENALGFSLDFPPSLLVYANIALGSGVSGATLVSNTNQASSGLLGVLLSLAPGMTLTAGTQELVEVSFVAAALTNSTVAQLFFSDQPTSRQISDVNANPLPATYGTGSISIAPTDFEGDITPRPDGDKKVTVTDWVLAGRYAAKLDAPATGAQYQRADCAPRDTLGDGAISVADWVQVGRYAAGLDPMTVAGGPTHDVGPNAVTAGAGSKEPRGSLAHRSNDLNPRQVRITDVSLAQGQSANLSVLLDAQGGENAAGFTVQFDPAVFSFNGAMLGADAPGATLEINSGQAASGRVAFALALPTGTSLSTGTKELIKLNLRAAVAAAGSHALALSDQPVVRQVVDATATALNTSYINGNITINPPPSLSIVSGHESITLSWPAWASKFVLQQADGPSLSWTKVNALPAVANNVATVQLPLTASTKFYRLQSP